MRQAAGRSCRRGRVCEAWSLDSGRLEDWRAGGLEDDGEARYLDDVCE
jgi:hypothetical protein